MGIDLLRVLFKAPLKAPNESELTERETETKLSELNKKKGTKEMLQVATETNRQTPEPLEGMVTNFTKSGAAFVRVLNSNKDIFVPTSIAEKANIDRGDQVVAFAVPNKLYETWTPDLGVMRPAELFAIYLMSKKEFSDMTENAQSDEIITEEPLRPRIVTFLKDGPATARMIADDFGHEGQQRVFDTLNRMWEDGDVSRASVRRSKSQSKDSFVIWALAPSEFLPNHSDGTEINEQEYQYGAEPELNF